MTGSSDSDRAPGESWPDRLWWVACVALALGMLGQAGRALANDWIPAGDDGYWALMARSVFSSHPPLLGSSSSGGLTSGTGFHHLGPLGFYLLAPFVAVLGGTGLAAGVAVINAACALSAAIAVRAGVGVRPGWFALVGSASLALVMGTELLVDPWNPHFAVLPLWLGLCGSWAVLRGATGWAAPTLVALSLSVQTHLSFVPVGVLCAAVTLGAATWWCRRRRAWTPLAVAAGVLVLANLPVLVQQLFADGPGNLTAIFEGSRDQGEAIGLRAGLGVVAQPLLQPWNWAWGSWAHHVVGPWELGSAWLVVAAVGGLVALAVWASRRGDAVVAADSLLALALLAAAVGAAGTLPFRIFGVPMSLARWVWPTLLLVQLLALESLLAMLPVRVPAPVRRWGPAAGCVAVLGLVVANVPYRDEGSGASAPGRATINAAIDEVAGELARIDRPLVGIHPSLLGNDAAVALLDWFDEQGIHASVDDPVALRQAGAHHRVDGTETATVLVLGGASALEAPPAGFRIVAQQNPVPASDVAWRADLLEHVEPKLDDLRALIDRDPGARERIGVPQGENPRLATYSWYELLCMAQTALPTGSAVVQDTVLSDADRERLCRIDDELTYGSIAVLIGPPPGA